MYRSKMNLQLFAAPDDGGGSAGDPPATPPATPPAAGKTFTEDYVTSLRGESANYRTRAKAAETAIRKALNIPEGEELGDVSERLTKAQQATLAAANDRFISAELRSLEGYDHKLLDKLIDRTKITVDDKGEVKGLKEAVEAVAKEFPAVKTSAGSPRFVPPNPAATESDASGISAENKKMNNLIRGAR